MSKDLAQMQKEAVVAYCELLLQDFLGITEEKSHIILSQDG
jgi:hypothetical protein